MNSWEDPDFLESLRLPDDWAERFKNDPLVPRLESIADMEFLESCGIDAWDAAGMIRYMNEQQPWEDWDHRRNLF